MLWVRGQKETFCRTLSTLLLSLAVSLSGGGGGMHAAVGAGRCLVGYFFFFYPSASVGGFSAAGTGGGAKGRGLVEVPSSGRKDEPSEKSSSEVESWLV